VLDGSDMIKANHLRLALAVWQYSDESARMIFSPVDAEAEDPLEHRVLGIIHTNPGVSRKGLHRGLGGHTPASNLVKVLAKLRDRRLIGSETVHTGGRPRKCRWPVQTMPLCVGHAVATPAEAAIERTKSQEPQQSQACVERQTQNDSSIFRTAPPDGVGPGADENCPMTLLALFAQVRELAGKIVRSQGGFAIQGVEASSLTRAILAALVARRSELDSIVPVPPLTDEIAILDTVTPSQPVPQDDQASVAANSPYRFGKCGVAVAGAGSDQHAVNDTGDALCDPFLEAEFEGVKQQCE
jgi:hypothetical protein